MVKRFVTKARHHKFETLIRNLLIEQSLLRRRVEELEDHVYGEEEEED